MKWQGDEYEVVILGSGLGGLIAATCLSKEHLRVLLLKESQYDPLGEGIGYRFVPFSNFSEKRIRSTLIERVSKELDCPLFASDQGEAKRDEIKSKKRKQRVDFQTILPKARIALFRERSRLQMELKREFPKEVVQIGDLYNQMEKIWYSLKNEKAKEGPRALFPIQPRYLIRRGWPFRTLPKGRMDELLASVSREFREFIRLQLISKGNLFPDRFPISLASYLFFHDETEEWASEVDLEMLKEGILKKFLQSGGIIEEIAGLERLEKKWRKGFLLSTRMNEKSFRSKYLVFNSPLNRLSALLEEESRLLSRRNGRIQPRYVLIPLFLGIRENVVPVGMGDLLVSILDLDKPYEGGNLLFLSLSQKGGETEAPDGRRALTVESLMIPKIWDKDLFTTHQKGVMNHLCRIIPFLQEHIEYTDWDWAEKQYPCWSYPHFLYETASNFNWREGVVPNRITKRCYFVGKENFPYLGVEGEILSGLTVSQQILQEHSKRSI